MTETWQTGKKVKPVALLINEVWVEQAVCAQTDPDLFHPENGASSLPAIRICLGCEVRDPCLLYALRHNESGVWGGKSDYQRQKMRRQLGITVETPIQHGTDAGARAHYRRGEKPCHECAQAQNQYGREQRNKRQKGRTA